MGHTTIGRPPAQTPDLLSCYPSPKRSFLPVTQELTNKGRLHTSDDHSSVTRGGVISVIYKTHWLGLSEPSWGQEMDLQHSRIHILRYSAGTPDQHRQTNRSTAECASVRHSVSFLRTTRPAFWASSYYRVTRMGWIRRLRDTVIPQGARFWYKDDDGLWLLGKINASTTEDGVNLVRFSVDPRPIKTPSPSGALRDFDGDRTRFLVSSGLRRHRLPEGGST